MIPWSYNAAPKADDTIIWTQYDHINCLMIELLFQKYINGDTSYRQIPITGYYVIDFKFMVQINIQDPTKQRKVHRDSNILSRARPGENSRWIDSSGFLKPTLE